MLYRLLPLALLSLLLGCTQAEKTTEDTESTDTSSPEMTTPQASTDPHSFARPEEARVTHLMLDLSVDFEQKTLRGSASYQLEVAEGANELILDTRDLKIEEVFADGQPVSFTLDEPQEYLGQALHIPITPQTREVRVVYATAPQAAGLQWLSPAQTDDKTHPFLFSQSQAILARTWIPCQDSPGVRMTYQAKLKVPAALLPLMSASNPQEKNDTGVYEFEMKQPIPAYLLALAVGDLEFQALSERAGVYAAPSVLGRAAYEFGDLEKMIVAAENLYGKYQWERYDLLVLPASFPFGGMENPRLTFVTPTILAGDRSLVSLIAHELAHSWSGNLVTNATWDDFWLNEGFTVYFEYRIMEAVYGKEYAEMLALISRKELEKEVEAMKESNPEDTHLKLNLKGRDPDEGLTAIAYDKGYLFLRMLEERFGRAMFDELLRDYFAEYAFKTMTTEAFLDYLNENMISRVKGGAQKAMIDAWVYGEGIPTNAPEISSAPYQIAVESAQKWISGELKAADIEIENWKYQQFEFFLRSLPDSLSQAQMQELDNAFGFSKSGNSEVLGQWFLHVARNRYQADYPVLRAFLERVGRRKFIAPIYELLAQHPESKAWAKEVYQTARPNYHYVAYSTIDEILKD